MAADHGGFDLKERMKEWLKTSGYEVVDVGAGEMAGDDDYTDYAQKGVKQMTENDRLLLFCRNGLGMIITANRFGHIRCGLAFDREAVKRGRRDDDINALAVPADYLDEGKTEEMVRTFIEEPFSNLEKYRRRLSKLAAINSEFK